MHRVSNQGFSLMEVILATVVFTVAAGGFFTVLTSVRQPVASNDKTLEAAQLGDKLLEDIRKNLGVDTWTDLRVGVTTESYTHKGVTYTIIKNVALTNPLDEFSPKKMRMTIRWPNGG